MEVLLKDLKWFKGNIAFSGDVRISRGKIKEIGSVLTAGKKERVIHLGNHYLYPGMINGHDHLEMNLYPHMGTPPYKNYTQWAKDIYRPIESPVREIEAIPIRYRLLWGGIKNLISGVTTVVHHNPWHRLLGNNFPVKVLKKYSWAHSLAFDKKVVQNFLSKPNIPFIIHAAEGVDDLARGEIQKLNELGVLKNNTVLIHCVGLSNNEIHLIQDAQASVVWCPTSNFFMFNKTANVLVLKKSVRVALGSDSTMTGPSLLLEEMKVAVKTGQVNSQEVFDMVTSTPMEIFNLPDQSIKNGAEADLLILPIDNVNYYENLLDQKPETIVAVFVQGKFMFGEESLAKSLHLKLHRWKMGSAVKAIAFDVADLRTNILKKSQAHPLNGNPLWQMLNGD